MKTAFRLLVATIALFSYVIVSPTGAISASNDAPKIQITRNTPWIIQGQEASVSVQVTNASQVKTLRFQIHSRVTSELRTSLWLTKGYSSNSLKTINIDNDGSDVFGASFVLPPDDPALNALKSVGAYPLSVSALSKTDKQLATTRSFFVTPPTAINEDTKLGLNVNIQLFSTPQIGSNGRPDIDKLTQARIDNALTALSQHQDTKYSLNLFGDSAQAFSDDPKSITTHQLRSLSNGEEIVGGQWGEPTSTLNSSDIAEQIIDSTSRIKKLGLPQSKSIWISKLETTDAVSQALSTLNSTALVTSIKGLRSTQTSTVEFPIKDVNHNFTVLPTDEIANEALAMNSPAGVQGTLAALTTRYLLHPNKTKRHIVLLTSSHQMISASSINSLLSAMAAAPFLRLETVSEQLQQPLVNGRVITRAAGQLDETQSNIRNEVRSELADFDSIVLTNNQLAEDLHAALLTADTGWLSKQESLEYWATVRETIGEQFSKILPPPNTHVRLTTQVVTLPITVRSLTGYPVKVKVELQAPRIKFISGSSQTLLVDRASRTARFRIKATSSGTFPVKVVLKSPTRNAVLGQSLMSINSFAATHVGLYLSVAALLVLAFWWIRSIWRKKRTPTLVDNS